jgi:hypothetical protein
VGNHQRRLNQAMSDATSIEYPLDVPSARHTEPRLLFFDDVGKRCGWRPDDLHAAILKMPVNMKVAARDH